MHKNVSGCTYAYQHIPKISWMPLFRRTYRHRRRHLCFKGSKWGQNDTNCPTDVKEKKEKKLSLMPHRLVWTFGFSKVLDRFSFTQKPKKWIKIKCFFYLFFHLYMHYFHLHWVHLHSLWEFNTLSLFMNFLTHFKTESAGQRIKEIEIN